MRLTKTLTFALLSITLFSCDTLNLFIDQESKLNRKMDGGYKILRVIQENMSSNDGGWSYSSEYDTIDITGTIEFVKASENECTGTIIANVNGSSTSNKFNGSYFDADSDDPTIFIETTDNSDIQAFMINNEPSSIVECHFDELDAGKTFTLRVSWGAWDASAHINRRFYFEKK